MRRLLVLVLVLPLLPIVSIAQTTTCDGNFHLVHALGSVSLSDVDFGGPGDGWAVGFDYPDAGRERPLVVRFDDDGFEKMTPAHDSDNRGMRLQGVAALAPDDVHAVGYIFPERRRDGTQAIAFHWNGSRWAKLDVPSPGDHAWLNAVSAAGPHDVWAVGHYEKGDAFRTLVLHYDGSGWSRVRSPSPSGWWKMLNDVDALSANQAWAVGSFTGRYGRERPLALRWDGTEWKRQLFGLEFPRSQKLLGVDVVSPHDVWAVGVGPGRDRPLLLHYDGTGWSKSEFPNARGWERLNGVAGTVAQGWVVGQSSILKPYETSVPLAARWVGGQWERVSYEGDDYGGFEAVTLDETGAAWAVGHTFDPEGSSLGEVIEKACMP